MDRSLKEIIKEVGKEYDMDDNIIDEIIKKLQKEFYVKLKHMKNLSIVTWKSLNLPINLFYVLNELYQSALKQEQSAQNKPQVQQPNNTNTTNIQKPPQPQNQAQTIPQPQAQQNKQINNIQNYIKDPVNLPNIVQKDLSLLFTEIDNLDKSKQVFKQIHKIISNISQNQIDQKFRKFNINKFLSNFNYKNIIIFFSHIGFKKIEEYMYLLGDAKNINIVMSELNKFIKDNKIAESTFDPFKSSISSLSGNDEKFKLVQSTETNFESLYYKEINRRNKIIRTSKIERKPKLFELEKNYSLNKIISTINQIDEDLISNSKEDKMIIKKNLELLKEKENDRFTLKSRIRLEQLMKTPIYIKSDIRLKLPNEQILQGSFGLFETIGDIYNFIKDFLKVKTEKFNISTTPPLKRYLKFDRTIQEEKLYPNLLMYINFEKEFSGLDESKKKNIKSNLDRNFLGNKRDRVNSSEKSNEFTEDESTESKSNAGGVKV